MIEYKNEYLLTRFNGSGIRSRERKNMIFKVQEQTFVTYVPRIQYFISNGRDKYLTKDGTISTTAQNGWWHTRKEAEIFLAGWQVLNPLPKPDLSQVDYEPKYEVGTRYIQYINSIRTIHRYCKVDFGITARDSNQKTYNYIEYRWFCTRL